MSVGGLGCRYARGCRDVGGRARVTFFSQVMGMMCRLWAQVMGMMCRLWAQVMGLTRQRTKSEIIISNFEGSLKGAYGKT